MRKCPNCSVDNEDNAKFCSNCGAALSNVSPAPTDIKATPAPAPTTGPGEGKVIAALILGIVSIVIAFIGIFVAGFICGLIGVVCGIVGICLAASAYKNGKRGGMFIAALICSIIGLIFAAVIFIIGIIMMAAIVSAGTY